jgi:murein DD-endopeptidase MepM/ murein hydrolase activator NlpD
MVHPSQQRPKYSPRRSSLSVTFKRGAKSRTLAVNPAVAGSAIGIFTLFLTAYLGATAYLVYRDDLVGAAVLRQVSMQYAYEERIAALRSELDRLSSRHAVQTEGVEQQLARLLQQQSLIESRQATLDQIVGRARAVGVNVAVGETAPERPATQAAAASTTEPLSYVADDPAQNDSISEMLTRAKPGDRVSLRDGTARPILARIGDTLDSTETELAETLSAVGTAVDHEVDRLSTVLAPIGVDVGGAVNEASRSQGGPLIPTTGMHFVERTALVARTLNDIGAIRSAALSRPIGVPVNSAHVSSRFRYRLDPFVKRRAFHAGIDFAASAGTTVRATAAGVVRNASWNGGYGNMLEVDHGGGVSTRYGHLSAFLISVGDHVEAGDPIARVGSTGRSTGPHLHYETLRGGKTVNPATYLAAGKALRTKS